MALHTSKAVLQTLAYAKNLRSVNASFKTMQREFNTFENSDERLPVAWPDPELGPLNVPTRNFVFPGNIGPTDHNPPQKATKKESEIENIVEDERHSNILSQLVAEGDYFDVSIFDSTMSDNIIKNYSNDSKLEMAIQDCPKVLKKDVHSLFPKLIDEMRELPENSCITILTVTQKTNNDMSMWSEEIDTERTELLESFIELGSEVSHLLRGHNYWCDFIDPSSGQAYFGAYTNDTLFETDERYRHLGFDIDDLGCCKVIMHKQWGVHSFVGTIFTNAPKHHPVFKTLLNCLK